MTHTKKIPGSLTVKIAADLHSALKARAKVEDRPMATVLRRAFDLYIREQDEGWLEREELQRGRLAA